LAKEYFAQCVGKLLRI
ncbi:type I restriction enzyme, partial [Haemophilus influenzae]